MKSLVEQEVMLINKGEHDGMTKDLTNPGIVGVGSNEKRRT